ncbi:MAG: MFS transporter [Propionibacteriaceae bacterium]|nr:MFS transporter [Propionibacteriaceae bacterium]
MTTTSNTNAQGVDQTRSLRPFGLRDKLGYAFGDLGNDFTFILAASFLLIFYTNVLGISAAIAGTIMMGVRLFDAFIDVAVGRMVDRSKLGRNGRFRPWILRFAVPVAVASVLLYVPGVAGWGDTAKIAYAAVTYLLWSVLYSAVNIPYGSMAAVISADPTNRSSLSVFRTFGAFFAGMLISFTVPLLIYTKDAAGQTQVVADAFFWIAVVSAVLAVIAYLGCYKLSVERVQLADKPREQVAGLGTTLKSLGKNQAMVAIIVAALVLLISGMLVQAMVSYLWAIYFNNGALQSIAALSGMLPTLLLLPFATKLSRRFGKRELSSVGVAIAAAMYILLYFLPLQNSPIAFIALTMLAGLGFGAFNILIWAFITDVIDHQEVLFDQRDDGVVYSVYSWARKVGQALAAGLGGWALGWIGYQAGTTTQSADTVNGIYMLSTLVPGLLYAVVAAVLFFWYPLNKHVVIENSETLAQRHQAAAAE